jgi:hypothetical protein
MDVLIDAWENGYEFTQELKTSAKNVRSGVELGPYIEKYFENLEQLELKVKPIMDKAHIKAGLNWRGREETGGLIRERPTSGLKRSDSLARIDTCSFMDGDLD